MNAQPHAPIEPPPQERDQLRRARRAMYLAPVGAGLWSVAIVFALPALVGPRDGLATTLILGGILLAGVVSAYAAARLHPVHRRHRWRAGAAFLLAVPAAIAASILFAISAEVALASLQIAFAGP